jgi:uncharacterized membrane protein HdeD (DUF308 family)
MTAGRRRRVMLVAPTIRLVLREFAMADRPSVSETGRPQARGVGPALLRILLGVVTFVAGWAVMVWPGRSLAVVAVLAGGVLLLAGVIEIVLAFTLPGASGASRVMAVVLGMLYLIAGIVCVRHVALTIAALSLLLGFVWIASGTVAIYRAAAGADDRLVTGVAGAVGVLVGIVVLVYPLASAAGAIWVVGGALAALGVVTIVQGMRARAVRAA